MACGLLCYLDEMSRDFLKITKPLTNQGVKECHFDSGTFFNGGDLQVRVDKYTESQCTQMGLDPKTNARQVFCQGRCFTEDGREFHFVLNAKGDSWDFKMLQAGLDSWSASTLTFTLPTTDVFMNELAKALEYMIKGAG